MLLEVMQEVNNFFVHSFEKGTFYIYNNKIDGLINDYRQGQYIRLVGSFFNDGIYQYPTINTTKNEEFKGTVYGLKIPNDFLKLVTKIENFEKENPKSIYQSENLPNYSYTKATKNGEVITWQSNFSRELNKYRKIGGIYGYN